jgi:PAS domain S-box-containing protein
MKTTKHATTTAQLVTRLTVPLALVIGFAPIIFYWTFSYVRLATELEGSLKIQAVVLNDFIAKQPDTWDVATDRLLGTLDRYLSYENGFRIYKGNEEVVVAVAPTLPGPFLFRDILLHAFGHPTGRLVGQVSLRQELLIGLVVLGVSLIAAWLVWGPLRRIPLKALATAELNLRTRDLYQRALLDNFPFLVWLKDTENRFLAVNAKFLESTGLPTDDVLIGKPDVETSPLGLTEISPGDARDTLAEGKPRREERWVESNVQRRCFEIYTSPVFLNDQRTGTVGYAQDITARKLSVEALRRSQELEQILAKVSSQLIGLRFETLGETLQPLLDIVGNGIGVGQIHVYLFVDSASTLLSSRSAAGEPRSAPACMGRTLESRDWILSRLRNDETVLIPCDHVLSAEAGQEQRHQEEDDVHSMLIVPLKKSSELLGFMEASDTRPPKAWPPEDISFIETFARILANGIEAARLERTLRYNERRYLDLIENLTEGLCSFDRNGNINFLNKSMANMLGYEAGERLDAASGKGMTEEVVQALREKHQESLRGKTATHAFELVHKEGRRVFINASISPMRDEQGNIVGTMALLSDLTKERVLQLQLIHAQRLEALGQLAAGIAHEINTPAQYVDSNIHFLKSAFDDLLAILKEHDALLKDARAFPPLAEAVEKVEVARKECQVESLLAELPGAFNDTREGLQRIALIVDSVKRFAHPCEDALQLANINDALRSTIVVAQNEWKYVAEVRTDFDPGLPPVPCVLSDINQVVLNLIVNAAHAIAAIPERSADAKGLITVRTRVEDGWAVIEVQDTGTGIPVAIQSRVFDPFFTTKEVGCGTGQGLAISRTVVEEKHRGAITFQTEEGKGTTFIVRLPIDQSEKPGLS